jgi:hypothetical protein
MAPGDHVRRVLGVSGMKRSSSVGREPEPLRNKANSGRLRGKAAIASLTPDVDAESAIQAEGRRYANYP